MKRNEENRETKKRKKVLKYVFAKPLVKKREEKIEKDKLPAVRKTRESKY